MPACANRCGGCRSCAECRSGRRHHPERGYRAASRGVGALRARIALAPGPDVVQAESVEAVRNIEGIVAVRGIEWVLLDPIDLTRSRESPGSLTIRRMRRRFRSLNQRAGRPIFRLGSFGMTPDRVRPLPTVASVAAHGDRPAGLRVTRCVAQGRQTSTNREDNHDEARVYCTGRRPRRRLRCRCRLRPGSMSGRRSPAHR